MAACKAMAAQFEAEAAARLAASSCALLTVVTVVTVVLHSETSLMASVKSCILLLFPGKKIKYSKS